MKVMYLSSHNPSYKRKEQVNTADIVFLKKLCKNAGISLKVTSKTIVLFDEVDYEKKSSVKKIKAGKGNILSYSFSTKRQIHPIQSAMYHIPTQTQRKPLKPHTQHREQTRTDRHTNLSIKYQAKRKRWSWQSVSYDREIKEKQQRNLP